MQVKDVINHLEEIAPLSYAEGFDNVGLLVGSKEQKVTGIIVTLDTLESVLDEAIDKKCNMVISFHPIIFSGLKNLTGNNYVQRVVLKAIKNNISIYAIHTALDNMYHGTNALLCNALGIKNYKILIPQKDTIQKLTVFVPKNDADNLKNTLFSAGAGDIGNYSECSFSVLGEGTYLGNKYSNPKIGKKGIRHKENEQQISVIFEKHKQSQILRKLFEVHPYEEVAYELQTLNNTNPYIGIGMIGDLEIDMDELDFLKKVKKSLGIGVLKYSVIRGKKVKKVAVLGGSGSFAIDSAKRQGADAFLSADIKYHQFYQGENDMIIADVGHYESEQFIKSYIVSYLTKKIPNFAVILSETKTNPVNYL